MTDAQMKCIYKLIVFLLMVLLVPVCASGSQETVSPEQNFLFGRLKLDQGDFDKALLHFEAAIAQKPDDPKHLLYLGRTYEQLEDQEKALQSYRQALNIHPNYLDALFAVGAVCRASDRWPEAVLVYTRAAAVDRTSAKAYYDLARAYEGWGKSEKALTAMRKAYVINPDFVMQASRLLGISFDESVLAAKNSGIDETRSDQFSTKEAPALNSEFVIEAQTSGSGMTRGESSTDTGQSGKDISRAAGGKYGGTNNRLGFIVSLLLGGIVLAVVLRGRSAQQSG